MEDPASVTGPRNKVPSIIETTGDQPRFNRGQPDTSHTEQSAGKKSRYPKVFVGIFCVSAFLLGMITGFTKNSGVKENPAGVDKAIVLGASQITIPQGSNLSLTLDTDLPNGTNNVTVYVMKKNPPTTRSEHFGVSGAHGEWDLLPGLVQMYNNYWGSNNTGDEMLDKHYAMLEAIGIKWIRVDQSWEREEPTQGVFDFQYVDKIVAAAKRHNLQIMMSLSYTPSWSYNQCPGKPAANPHFTTPVDLNSGGSALYNRFATKMVERYKPYGTFDKTSGYGITYWQIWNEPDLSFWTDCQTGQSGNMQTYAYLLKSVYLVIKVADPNAKVITGGLSHLNPITNLTSLYGYLPTKPFDILDLHNYENVNAFTPKINAFADVRNAKGDSTKEIWLSETSIENNVNNPADPVQTNYMKSIFEKFESLISSRNLGKAFWWSTRKYFFSAEEAAGANNGIFGNNFYPQKVYFDLGEWLGTIRKKGEVPAPAVTGGKLSITIPPTMLDEIGNYVIFYASKSKMNIALPLTVEVTSPSSSPTPIISPNVTVTPTPNPSYVPNCTQLTGPSTVILGQSATYTASFTSSQGNFKGEVVAGQNGSSNWVWFPGGKSIPGTGGSLSYTWTPTTTGTFDVFCRAWNGATAECRGLAKYVVAGPQQFTCNGPSSSKTVTVTTGSSTAPTPAGPTPTPKFTPTSFPRTTPTQKIGDANGDGKVDEADYAIWRSYFGKTASGKARVGDFNSDGKIDGADFVLWLKNYGK